MNSHVNRDASVGDEPEVLGLSRQVERDAIAAGCGAVTRLWGSVPARKFGIVHIEDDLVLDGLPDSVHGE